MFLAEIENIGVLAVKRAHASDVAFIQGQPLVDDICVVLTNEGEEVPEGYVSLDRVSTQKEAGRAAKTSQTASKLVLAYHQRPAMGLCDLSYESTTLDRYPQKVRNSSSSLLYFFMVCKFTTALLLFYRISMNSHCLSLSSLCSPFLTICGSATAQRLDFLCQCFSALSSRIRKGCIDMPRA